jgi:hypothetical protein
VIRSAKAFALHTTSVSLLLPKKTIGPDDDLAIREIWELCYLSTGVRELFEAPEDPFCVAPEALCGFDVVSANVSDGGQKLRTSGWSEPKAHRVIFW